MKARSTKSFNNKKQTAVIYLIHLEQPLAHARHYIGMVASNASLDRRLREHRTGRGARILDACNRQGIAYRVVRTMAGGRPMERRLKSRKNGPKLCPVCNPLVNHKTSKP